MVSLRESFWIKEVSPFIIHSGMLASRHLLLQIICREWTWIPNIWINPRYHDSMLANFVLSWGLVFVIPSLCHHSAFFKSVKYFVLIYIYSVFLWHSFCSHTLFPKGFVSLAFDCLFVFIFSPLSCWENLLSLLLQALFSFYCMVLSWRLLRLTLFPNAFWFLLFVLSVLPDVESFGHLIPFCHCVSFLPWCFFLFLQFPYLSLHPHFPSRFWIAVRFP